MQKIILVIIKLFCEEKWQQVVQKFDLITVI